MAVNRFYKGYLYLNTFNGDVEEYLGIESGFRAFETVIGQYRGVYYTKLDCYAEYDDAKQFKLVSILYGISYNPYVKLGEE